MQTFLQLKFIYYFCGLLSFYFIVDLRRLHTINGIAFCFDIRKSGRSVSKHEFLRSEITDSILSNYGDIGFAVRGSLQCRQQINLKSLQVNYQQD